MKPIIDISTPSIMLSRGNYSLHDVIEGVVNAAGQCDVCLTSFSISEDSVRSLALLRERNQICNLRCILDYTMRTHKVALMLFLTRFAEVRTIPNHSKIILLSAPTHRISIVASANLSPNPRAEVYRISNCTNDFAQYQSIFEELWTSSISYTSPASSAEL